VCEKGFFFLVSAQGGPRGSARGGNYGNNENCEQAEEVVKKSTRLQAGLGALHRGGAGEGQKLDDRRKADRSKPPGSGGKPVKFNVRGVGLL